MGEGQGDGPRHGNFVKPFPKSRQVSEETSTSNKSVKPLIEKNKETCIILYNLYIFNTLTKEGFICILPNYKLQLDPNRNYAIFLINPTKKGDLQGCNWRLVSLSSISSYFILKRPEGLQVLIPVHHGKTIGITLFVHRINYPSQETFLPCQESSCLSQLD